MSGLGIVLEEAESPVPSRAILAAPTPQSPRIAPPNFTDSEALLPPLPDDAAATVARTSTASPLVAPSRLHFQMTGSPVASNMEFADESSPSQSISYDNDLVRTQQSHKVLSDLFSDHSMYELDSSALNESTPMSFPPADSTSSGNNTVHSHQPPSSTSGSAGSTTNTSPLKRLKSLKNGIRKLSLSKMSSSSSVSSPVVAETPVAPPRPTLTPTYTDPSQDVSSSSSTGDSLRSSTFSSSAGVGQSAPASGSTPQAPAHIHTASSGSLAKARRRTLSGSHCTSAATTPPLPSPIITLSENLNTTKETMVDIEQNFFENIGTVGGAASDKDNLGKLTTSDELIEYSLYLNEHKKLVVGAYDATRERLISSGWCSNHDLENLSLQRDSSLSQIDTKLLQIEEKLNSEYQLSMLNNPTSAMPRGKHASNLREASLSPSLKVLESRCFAFTGSEVELR